MFDMVSEILYRDIERTDPFIFNLKKIIDLDRLAKSISKQLPSKLSNSGRPPYPLPLMLGIVILQEINNLSDQAMERHVNTNHAYKYFLDMDILDHSPDEKTIWLFKETLRKHNIEQVLFDEFHKILFENKIQLSKGSIVDASFVKVPIQRNTREENKEIKEGKIPEKFKENPHKLSQKDTDARWTKKNKKSYYGYKNHIAIDSKNRFIEKYSVSSASNHDSTMLKEIFLSGKGRLYGDSAYRSAGIEEFLQEENCQNFVHHKAHRNRPLTEKQRGSNKRKSKTRARVEHVFGRMRMQMNRGLELRCIGIDRVKFRLGLRNTIYNMLNFMTLTL